MIWGNILVLLKYPMRFLDPSTTNTSFVELTYNIILLIYKKDWKLFGTHVLNQYMDLAIWFG